jgi:transposase
MIQITPHMKILFAVDPVDFRKGIDGLAGVCRTILQEDPFSGCLFLFRNKTGMSVKILMYDGQGFWLCQKRFSKGRLKFWPNLGGDKFSNKLEAHQLQMLLWNVNPLEVTVSQWKKIKEKECNFF